MMPNDNIEVVRQHQMVVILYIYYIYYILYVYVYDIYVWVCMYVCMHIPSKLFFSTISEFVEQYLPTIIFFLVFKDS